jgi:hypothetical protein
MKALVERTLIAAAIAGATLVPTNARADCGAMDPRSFGATGNGCTDDRNAIQAAANAAALACGGAGGHVALSPGKYRVNSMITLPKNVGMIGTSPIDTQITVSTQACSPNTGTFNPATQTAVITLAPPPGTEWSTAPMSGFGVTFTQPDTTDRELMIRYPVAIRADARPGLRFSNVWITNAWDGISLLGNSGASSFSNVYMAAYNVGFDIDNAQASMRFNGIECAPNILTTWYQQIALRNLASICFRSGRVDDLHITDSVFLQNTGVLLYESANGSTFGSIVGTDFDFDSQLRVSAGILNLSACTFTSFGTIPLVLMTGGDVRIDGSWFYDSVTSTLPTVSVAGFATSLLLSDTTVSRGAGKNIADNFVDRTFLSASGAGNVRLETILFRGLTTSTAVPVRPTILFSNNSRGSINNSYMYDTAAASPGVFVQVTHDNWVNVTANQFMGWRMLLPASSSFITARLNTGLGAGSSGQRDAAF